MAQLSTIISSILRDMVFAQHQANMYAVTLSEAYKKGGRVEDFPLPSVALGEMELEIAYGVSNVENEKEQFEIDYPKLREHSMNIAFKIAKLLTKTAIEKVKELKMDDDVNTLNLLEKLDDDATTRQRFYTFLSRKIIRELQSDFTSLINDDGTVNQAVLIDSSIKIANDDILYNEELINLFNQTIDGKSLRDIIKEQMKINLENTLASILDGINLKRKRIMPSVEVMVNSSDLAKMPEDCLNTIKFKISPNKINLNLTDNLDDIIYE
jgi:hypothetical protein